VRSPWATRALRQANARMEGMLESLTDGFCSVDREWRIGYINGRALALLSVFDLPPSRLTGQVVWDVFPELRDSAVEQHFRRAMAAQQTISFEFYYPKLECWFDLRLYPSPDGLTVYFQDITGARPTSWPCLTAATGCRWRWRRPPGRLALGRGQRPRDPGRAPPRFSACRPKRRWLGPAARAPRPGRPRSGAHRVPAAPSNT
jgi:PAS domain-containing protein